MIVDVGIFVLGIVYGWLYRAYSNQRALQNQVKCAPYKKRIAIEVSRGEDAEGMGE